MFRRSCHVALCIRIISVYSPGFFVLLYHCSRFSLLIVAVPHIVSQPFPILFAILHSYIIAAVSHIVLSDLPSWQGFFSIIMSSSPPALRPNAAQGVSHLPSCSGSGCTVERTNQNCRCISCSEQALRTLFCIVGCSRCCFWLV